MAQELISVYQVNKDLIANYPAESKDWSKALITPGQGKVSVKMAELSSNEVELILTKLDMLAINRNNPAIAAMVAEEADSILTAVRMVKTETKEPFMGMLGAGSTLDMMWLRAEQIGGSILDANTDIATTGPWQNNDTRWLASVTAGTDDYIIDPQTMREEAAMVHLGAIDPVEVPKVEAVTFEIAGIATPAQVTPFAIRGTFGNQSVPFVRWEKPVIIGPEKKGAIECAPHITGDTKMQLLTILIARAQDLTL